MHGIQCNLSIHKTHGRFTYGRGPMGPVDPDDMVGAAEIAERLGLRLAQTVHDWARRHPDFPRPVAKLRMGHVWRWSEVKQWADETGRPRRRP